MGIQDVTNTGVNSGVEQPKEDKLQKKVRVRNYSNKVEKKRLFNYFPDGKLNPVDWKSKATEQARRVVNEPYNIRKKTGRPYVKRKPVESSSTGSDCGQPLKRFKGITKGFGDTSKHANVMEDFVRACYEGNFVRENMSNDVSGNSGGYLLLSQ